ncbi:hypothetical protein tb265_20050 [Gemmatimonadetes bacterium T265]|nr:hypothetical protein tb265_20050 [Gemmatimonadetes bacterium T265]
MTGFEAGHAARRELHRDRPGREGMEAELVERLTAELTPSAARHALARCLEGGVTPPAALAQLLLACRNVTLVRELVDEVTARADADSRAGDALVRDRADALTRLFVDNAPACARALARWSRTDEGAAGVCDALAHGAPTASDDEATVVGYYEEVFARVVRAGADAGGEAG